VCEAAAEGMIAASDQPHAFSIMRTHPISKEVDFNLVVNWLKHPTSPEENAISEFEAAMLIVRAISKTISVHGDSSGSLGMRDFVKWAFDTGLLPGAEGSPLGCGL
jgi:hypothetical protein